MASTIDPAVEKATQELRAKFQRVRDEIGKAIVGHDEIVQGVLTALFVGGHVLLEGVPGLGKTYLIRTLADALDLKFSRIQFTPDLMPADIIGTTIISEDPATGKRSFEFQKGPLFAQIVLADEINRATPKTQSALLEAMQEHTVTTGGTRFDLEEPFFVMATQNPIEQEGTYPLPEAQLDRFMFKLLVTYSNREDLKVIMDRTTTGYKADVRKVMWAGRSSERKSSCAASSWPRTCRTMRFAWPSRRTRTASSPWKPRTATSAGARARAPCRRSPCPRSCTPCSTGDSTRASTT